MACQDPVFFWYFFFAFFSSSPSFSELVLGMWSSLKLWHFLVLALIHGFPQPEGLGRPASAFVSWPDAFDVIPGIVPSCITFFQLYEYEPAGRPVRGSQYYKRQPWICVMPYSSSQGWSLAVNEGPQRSKFWQGELYREYI